MVRILIVDDRQLIRDGLTALLAGEEELKVIGQAENGRVGVELALALKPDVVVMDINMPVLDGVEATRQIIAAEPSIKVIVFSVFDAVPETAKVVAAGAVAVVAKDKPEQLLAVLRQAVVTKSIKAGP